MAQLEWVCGIACGVGWPPSAEWDEWDDRCLPAYVVPAGQISRKLDGMDRKTAAETCGYGRLYGTGCIVTTPRDWPGFAISNRRVLDRNSRRGSRPNWPSLSRPARTPQCTASCVGDGSICATNYSDASASCYTSVRSGRSSPSSAIANYRSDPATHRLTKRPRRRLKKLRRDSHGANPRPRQRQADRNLVPDAMRTG